ncbi:hypothetical protein ACWDUN_28670 [Mycobacterium sp. NPDC003323]
MLDTARKVLRYEMRVAEWIGLSALLAIPYLAFGVVWAATHSGPVPGSVLAWPLLLLYSLCGL